MVGHSSGIEIGLGFDMVRVTEASALACGRLMGRGDERLADQEATRAMEQAFRSAEMNGTICVSKGGAPALAVGQKLGTGALPVVDVVVDALEGTNICATGGPNSLSVIVLGSPGSFLSVPDIYMEKIAVGAGLRGVVDLALPVADNIDAVAGSKQCRPEELTVVILDRPRHAQLVAEIRRTGARIKLIGDGDVSAAIATAVHGSGVDVLIGIGGAPEGVMAAAALQCLGGDMQGRLVPRGGAASARDWSRRSLGQVLNLDDLAKPDDLVFAATGVTDGDVLKGIRFSGGGATTHSMLAHLRAGTVRFVVTEHSL